MTKPVWLFILIGGLAGSLLAALFGQGSMLSGWNILFSTLGSLAGVWVYWHFFLEH